MVLKYAWIKRIRFNFDYLLWTMGALFVVGGLLSMIYLANKKIDQELSALEQKRDSAITDYFQSTNIILLDSMGNNRYEVLTEKGTFVVELSKDLEKVIKALPKGILDR